MKIRSYILLFCVFTSYSGLAQKNEVGAWLGGADYFGDVNTQTSFRFVNPAGGVFFRHNFDERISTRINVGAGRIWADDAYANNYYQQTRNLGFASVIYEGNAMLEFNFLPYSTEPFSPLNAKHRFSPFVAVGFGVFHFNPFVIYNGDKVFLQPLGTEGQGYPQYPELNKYKRTSTAYLVGGGFKFRVGRLTGITLEGAVRKTSTDYLDDVSGVYADPLVLLHEGGPEVEFLGDPSVEVGGEPVGSPGKMRGDSKKNDDYFLFGIGFSYTLVSYRCPYPK